MTVTLRPLASRWLARSSDVDEIQRAISGITRSAHQHAMDRTGETVGDVAGLSFDSFGLASVAYNGPATITADPLPDRLVAIVPLAPMKVDVGDRAWVSSAPFLLSNSVQTTFEPAPRAGGLAVSLDPHIFQAYIAEAGLRSGGGRTLLGGDATGRPLANPQTFRTLVLEVCRVIDGGSAEDGLVQCSLGSMLNSAMILGLRHALERQGAPIGGHRYFKDAVKVIEERYAEALTLDDLAGAVNLSQRHLHSIFVEYAEASPARFLRSHRLKKARELLLDPESARGLTVAGAARQVGMNHAGRFAAAYATQFGEQPSDTLDTTLGRSR